jgi:hypothetical protein
MVIKNLLVYSKALALIAIFTGSLWFYYSHSQSLKDAKIKEMLKMNYDEFDQSERGWRSLSSQDAAKLIDQYLKISSPLKHEKTNLYFHAGQLYAFIGDYQTALTRFRLSKCVSNNSWELSWNAYVDATVAFLEGNHSGLLNAKKTLEEYKDLTIDVGKAELLYPNRINLKVVENLDRGLKVKKTYTEAYRSE